MGYVDTTLEISKNNNDEFMLEAVKEAYEGIDNSHGGPFGAVIVKDGKIIGRGHNCVLKNQDPTQHGEIVAIRDACKTLGTYDLNGCELYTTAEPCPMCLGAILWSGIHKFYYGCDRIDTEGIGFRDNVFYDVLNGKADYLKSNQIEKKMCRKLFDDYKNIKDRELY